MKRNLLYILISLCVALTSCEDFLNVKPQTQVPTEDFFNYEAGYEDALIGCYVKMTSSNLYGRFLTMSGIDYLAQYYNQMSLTSAEYAFKTFDYANSSVEGQFKEVYNELYNVILQANDIIEHIDTKGAEVVKSEYKRNIIKGEALAIRAFCHLDILRIFGQLPQGANTLVSLPYSEVTGVEDRPLYAFDKYVEKLGKDLTTAALLLSNSPEKEFKLVFNVPTNEMIAQSSVLQDDFYTYRKFRFNYYAVKALQARFYQYIGDTANAYSCAMEIINEKSADGINTMTFDNETDFSKGYYTLPTESIFALSSSELENRTTELNRLFKLGNTTDNPMLINADRKKELFQTRNSGSNNRFNKLWGEYVTGSGQPQPYLRKYFQNEIAAADSEKSRYRWQFPILRLSEMYLIAMECSEDLTEVNNMFYTYMVARNEQPAPFESLEAAKAEIVNEYRREFIAEGQMFFTYKRFGSSTMLWNNTQIREENYIVPVPASEKH